MMSTNDRFNNDVWNRLDELRLFAERQIDLNKSQNENCAMDFWVEHSWFDLHFEEDENGYVDVFVYPLIADGADRVADTSYGFKLFGIKQ